MLTVQPLAIPDVKALRPVIHRDARGFFSETFKQSEFVAAGIDAVFVQDNHSLSAEVGVVRGLHFQREPYAQGKLLRVVRGAVFDVALDIRAGSPTYGQHVDMIITAENWEQIWIPPGFAHGFQTIEPSTEVMYKVTAEYSPAQEGGFAWNDPSLKIKWPIAQPILSNRDSNWPRFSDRAAA